MSSRSVRLPRDGTRQAEGLLYGHVTRSLNRWSGMLILLFVLAHLLGQGALRVDELAFLRPIAGGLVVLQYNPLVRAVLFAAISFHFLYGLKLMAMDLGMRFDYRASLWTIGLGSLLVGLLELVRYVAG